MAVTVLVMVTINENEPQALARYLEVTDELMSLAKAKIVQRFHVSEMVIGSKQAETIILVEYPDHEAVDLVFQSNEYQQLMTVRDKAFSSYIISVVSDI